MKAYQYQAIVIQDRGFLNDIEFLEALNMLGIPEKNVDCPWCNLKGHAKANGWKHKLDQPMGGTKQVVLLEREVEFECVKVLHPSDCALP